MSVLVREESLERCDYIRFFLKTAATAESAPLLSI